VAEHRHKRETSARRKPRAALVAAPLALLATGSAVGLGVLSANPTSNALVAQDSASITGAAPSREADTSRSSVRPATRLERRALQRAVDRNSREVASRAATRTAIRQADTRLWTTEDLNLWSSSGDDAVQRGEIEAGKRVLVTGREANDRVEVVIDGESRWVTAGYLSDEKPVAAAAGLSMEPCPDPSVESGLTDSAVYVYRSVCHAFPQITSYGGWDAHGEHTSGKAIDIMTSDVELGDAIAAFLQAHASELNLYDIIWRQRIWTPVRASEGWRSMPSRGSATADHYDHVHVATN
jgi:hypothetical protein